MGEDSRVHRSSLRTVEATGVDGSRDKEVRNSTGIHPGPQGQPECSEVVRGHEGMSGSARINGC